MSQNLLVKAADIQELSRARHAARVSFIAFALVCVTILTGYASLERIFSVYPLNNATAQTETKTETSKLG